MASGVAYHLTRPSCEMLDAFRTWGTPKKLTLARSDESGLGEMNAEPPSAGYLGSIPLDIMYEILGSLDYESTSRIRLLNSRYRKLVDSFPAYLILKNHARQTLRVMRKVKVDSRWSVGQIFAEMCYPRCRTCMDFGPFLFLPSCSRCCYTCLRSHSEYELAFVSSAKAVFALPEDAIKRLVALDNIPMNISSYPLMEDIWCEVRSCPRLQLVSVRQAYELSMGIYGDESQLDQAVKRCNTEWRKEWAEHIEHGPCYTADGRLVTEVFTHPRRIRLSLGPEMRGHNFCYTVDGRLIEQPPLPRAIESTKRIILNQYQPEPLGSTFFPFWDKRTQTAEPGMYCSACGYLWYGTSKLTSEQIRSFQRAYLSTEIQMHFERCEATQKGYRQRDWPQISRSRRPKTYRGTSLDFLVSGEAEISKVPPRKPQRTARKRKRKVSRA